MTTGVRDQGPGASAQRPACPHCGAKPKVGRGKASYQCGTNRSYPSLRGRECLKHENSLLREQIRQLLAEADEYTSDMHCVFCSGLDGYEDNCIEVIKHAPDCEGEKAREMLREKA